VRMLAALFAGFTRSLRIVRKIAGAARLLRRIVLATTLFVV
jgi:hypothetical protein